MTKKYITYTLPKNSSYLIFAIGANWNDVMESKYCRGKIYDLISGPYATQAISQQRLQS